MMPGVKLWQTVTLVLISAPPVYTHDYKEGYVVIEKHGTIWDIDENCEGSREWCGDMNADGKGPDNVGTHALNVHGCTMMGQVQLYQ